MSVLNISLNDFVLKNTTNNIKSASSALDTSTAKLPTVTTCSGIKVSEYESKCREIAELLNSYKKLLEKDLKDLEKLRTNLNEADKKAKEIFK